MFCKAADRYLRDLLAATGGGKKFRVEARCSTSQKLPSSKTFVLVFPIFALELTRRMKDEYVVFVTPSELQKQMFMKVLHPDKLSSLIRGSMARSLAMINTLTKLSTTPMLLKAIMQKRTDVTEEDTSDAVVDAVSLLPAGARVEDISLSGTSCSFIPNHSLLKERENR